MTTPVPVLQRSILAAATLISAACSGDPGVVSRCANDAACIAEHASNPNWICDPTAGYCACTSDAGCTGPGEHCETLAGQGDGLCHPNRSCEWNNDCPAGYCDTTTGICRTSGCSMDLHCGFGQVCDTSVPACVAGCRSHGDCALGDVCLCHDAGGAEIPCTCDGTSDSERANCPIGACVSGTCLDRASCDLGEQCVDREGAERPVCERDTRGPFCDNCVIQPGGTTCGSEGPNFCLVDTSDPAGRSSYCGVDCAGGEECPNGFSCHDVLVLTQSICQGDAACVPTGGECGDDDGCPPGARCVKAAGQALGRCGGRCMIGEGDASGFCACVTDTDCPQQSCGSDGRCTVTRERCVPGTSPDPCAGQIFCVNDGGGGYCQIGKNCAPDEGITCADVRNSRGP